MHEKSRSLLLWGVLILRRVNKTPRLVSHYPAMSNSEEEGFPCFTDEVRIVCENCEEYKKENEADEEAYCSHMEMFVMPYWAMRDCFKHKSQR